jgi:hypothetical protein
LTQGHSAGALQRWCGSHHRALDMTDNTRQACNHLRHALALPLYAIALIISCLSDVIGNIAAKIADDDWPR